MNKIKLSILEFGVRINPNPRAVVGEIMDYAATADKLNFHRFWLAEHHEADTSASFTNPEILLTLIASSTRKIRVGAGGALIGYTSPYTLASNYKLLNNLFSNRIDFGLSKGKPANVDKHDYFRLRDKTHSELFVDHLEAIAELYSNEEENFMQETKTRRAILAFKCRREWNTNCNSTNFQLWCGVFRGVRLRSLHY